MLRYKEVVILTTHWYWEVVVKWEESKKCEKGLGAVKKTLLQTKRGKKCQFGYDVINMMTPIEPKALIYHFVLSWKPFSVDFFSNIVLFRSLFVVVFSRHISDIFNSPMAAQSKKKMNWIFTLWKANWNLIAISVKQSKTLMPFNV